MMGKKKLSEIKAEVAALLAKLPGPSPRAWLEQRIKVARTNPSRNVRTLEALLAALEDEVGKKKRTGKSRRRAAKR